jgi:DNA modification methylase
MKKTKLMLGDNIQSLKKLPDNSVDSVVTDPPYGLSFMNKQWDYDVPSVEFWREVYRVLKPGGHILSFGGTRTYHRMVVNIEDAGFEIRDQIMWLYATGFPKSLNIGKAVDKLEGNEREVVGDNPNHRTTAGLLELGFQDGKASSTITKGNSPYEGWGTGLKPANEPICLARKPISEKTIAENVMKWGTGGINIDGCRVGSDDIKTIHNPRITGKMGQAHGEQKGYIEGENSIHQGRWAANIILECICDEVIKGEKGDIHTNPMCPCYILDKQSDKGSSRFFYQAKVSKAERNMGLDEFEDKQTRMKNNDETDTNYQNEKVAAKYQAIKAVAKNNHPTIKPVSLMAYLCRLITPEGGIVLDPFLGSGSTGIAALLEGFRFCGMELDADYMKIAEARIESYNDYKRFIK